MVADDSDHRSLACYHIGLWVHTRVNVFRWSALFCWCKTSHGHFCGLNKWTCIYLKTRLSFAFKWILMICFSSWLSRSKSTRGGDLLICSFLKMSLSTVSLVHCTNSTIFSGVQVAGAKKKNSWPYWKRPYLYSRKYGNCCYKCHNCLIDYFNGTGWFTSYRLK